MLHIGCVHFVKTIKNVKYTNQFYTMFSLTIDDWLNCNKTNILIPKTRNSVLELLTEMYWTDYWHLTLGKQVLQPSKTGPTKGENPLKIFAKNALFNYGTKKSTWRPQKCQQLNPCLCISVVNKMHSTCLSLVSVPFDAEFNLYNIGN